MRVVSLPQTSLQTAPVSAAERVGARSRDRAPQQEGVERRHGDAPGTSAASSESARTPRRYLQANPAMVGIGLTAQNMFHSENGGPAEQSVLRATKAYADIDGIRYRRTPFSYRVA